MRRALLATGGVLIALLAYGTLDAFDKVPGILTLAPEDDPAPAGSSGPPAGMSGTSPSGSPAVPLPSAAPSTLPGTLATPGLAPSPAGVASALAGPLHDPALAGLSITVRDPATGTHLLDVASDTPRIPASAMKILAAAAVDTTFPAGATLTTKAVQGATADQVVLVAGGDTLLAPGAGNPAAVAGHAGLGDLAAQTAAALKAAGVSKVSVVADTTYAAGPDYASTWSPSFLGDGTASKVTMLGLSTQRAVEGRSPGNADPVGASVQAFAAALTAAGVPASAVAGPAGRVTAPAGATQLGAVASAPVAQLMATAIEDSDNGLTEILARQASFVGGGATDFPGVAGYVRSTLGRLGVDTTGMSTVDASGLSRQNQVPVRVFADVISLAATGKAPAFSESVAQFPVAGLTGTLTGRFLPPSGSGAGLGLVHAKTGTLTGVGSLAGTLVDTDGRLLVFAMTDNSPSGTDAKRAALDRVAATLVQCGCH